MEGDTGPTDDPGTIRGDNEEDYKYRKMLVEVAHLLEKGHVEWLANLGGLPTSEQSEIFQKQEGWSYQLFRKLEQRMTIQPGDVSWLVAQLELLQHDAALQIVHEYISEPNLTDLPMQPEKMQRQSPTGRQPNAVPAQVRRIDYPFLTTEEFERYKGDKTRLSQRHEFAQDDILEKLRNFTLSETKERVLDTHALGGSKDELRIVLLGKTGQGKSATANTLLGSFDRKEHEHNEALQDYFTEGYTADSVTSFSRCISKVVSGRKLSVIDTPGLQDTKQTNKTILTEIGRIMKIHNKGVHAFIYVMNMADPRFTAEDRKVLDLLQVAFGGDFKRYCLLIFTYGDSRLKNITLNDYREAQLGNQGTVGQSDAREPNGPPHDEKEFAQFLRDLSWRIVAVDNKSDTSPFERNFFRETTFKMIDKMRSDNVPEYYTNGMFEKAQKAKEELRLKGLKKGWDPKVMGMVEEIINFNPEIDRPSLKKEVGLRLEKRRQEEIMRLKRKEMKLESKRKQEKERMRLLRMEEEKNLQALEREMVTRREEEEKRRLAKLEKERQAMEAKLASMKDDLDKELEAIKRLREEAEREKQREIEEEEQARRQKEQERRERRKREEEMRRMREVSEESKRQQDKLERQQQKDQQERERQREIKKGKLEARRLREEAEREKQRKLEEAEHARRQEEQEKREREQENRKESKRREKEEAQRVQREREKSNREQRRKREREMEKIREAFEESQRRQQAALREEQRVREEEERAQRKRDQEERERQQRLADQIMQQQIQQAREEKDRLEREAAAQNQNQNQQVDEIADEHQGILSKAVNAVVDTVKAIGSAVVSAFNWFWS